MAIILTVGGQLPNYPISWQIPKKPSPAYENASKGIHRLNYGDLWGGLGTILNEGGQGVGGIRIDRQNPLPAGGANVQVQLNGKTGHTSVAHVLLDGGLRNYTDTKQQAQQNIIITKVKAAFFQSLNHGTTVTVSGTP